MPIIARAILGACLAAAFVVGCAAAPGADRNAPAGTERPAALVLPLQDDGSTAPAPESQPTVADRAMVEITPSGPIPPVAEIVRRAATAEPTHTVDAMTVTTDTGARSRLWWQGNRSREEYAADSARLPGQVEVYDGDARWTYLPESDTYLKVKGPHYDTGTTIAATPMPQDTLFDRLLAPYDWVYDGMELVAGQAAYRLVGHLRAIDTATPATESKLVSTVWVDSATGRLLRAEIMQPRTGSEPIRLTYSDFAFDPAVPDGFFTLPVPPGKHVMNLDSSDTTVSVEHNLSVDAARRAVPFKLLAPGVLPPGIKLEVVDVSTTAVAGKPDLKTAMMGFSGPSGAVITVEQSPFGANNTDPKQLVSETARMGHVVQVNGRPAAMAYLGGTRSLLWATDDSTVRLFTSAMTLDDAQLIAMAEALH